MSAKVEKALKSKSYKKITRSFKMKLMILLIVLVFLGGIGGYCLINKNKVNATYHQLVPKQNSNQKIDSLDDSLSSNMEGVVEKIAINQRNGKVYENYVVVNGIKYYPDNYRELYDMAVGDRVTFRANIEGQAYRFMVQKRKIQPQDARKIQEESKHLPKGYTVHIGTIQEVAVNEPYSFMKINGYEYEAENDWFLYTFHSGDHISFYLDSSGKIASVHLLK